jgi:ABC-type polysaccharide/polyol phosphate export permease
VSQPGATPLQELVGARELLRNLTARELKVRYKRSTLGFVWTLLNPLLMMAVFAGVLGKVFGSDIPYFALYFLSGYLPFAFFQASVMVASGTVINNAGLITKVYFPRAVLPLSVVASQLVHFAMALVILLVAMAWVGFDFWLYLPGLALSLVLLAVFTAGVSMLFAAATTFLRDLTEFLPVAFLLLFYATPVIYLLDNEGLADWRWLIELNPITHFVGMIRSTTYELHPESSTGGWPGIETTALCTALAVAALLIGYQLFTRLSARFAKEV